jgi:hypothetical protein
MSTALTTKQLLAMRSIAWGQRHFGALVTGRVTTRATVRALERKSLACSAGTVAVCDGDGFLVQPQRYREGFRLTAQGLAFLIADDNNDAKVIARLATEAAR